MGDWYAGYLSEPTIGRFAGVDFTDAGINTNWHWLHQDLSDIRRQLILTAQYWGDDYKGGVPASGVEIAYSTAMLWSMDSNNPDELFAIRFGSAVVSPLLVVKAYRTVEASNEIGTYIVVNAMMYKRVYDVDGVTYTETFLSRHETSFFKPNTGNVTGSHGRLEFFADEGYFYAGFSAWFIGWGDQQKALWSLWNPEPAALRREFGSEEPKKQKIKSHEFGPAATPEGGYIPGGGSGPSENPGSGTGGIPKIPSFDNTSDKIEVDPAPTLSPLNSKFFNAYVVTEGMLTYISDALFPQPVWNQQDLIGMMGELGQVLFFNKQIDYMLDLLILPIDVPHDDSAHITVGGRELKTVIEGTTYYINGYPVTDVYVDVTCGSISIEEYWVNFLDFTGTKIKLFLPFIGYVDLQPEYVIGGTVYVDYRFNVIDGSFMCYVRSDSGYSELEESLIGQYAGVSAIHVPLQAQDYSNKISGLISAIGSVAGGVAGGGIGAAAGAGAAASAANTIIQKPGTSHANGYNASSSFLSHRTPYLIIERQWSQFSQKYPEEVGLPANMMCRLGDLSGLVKSSNAHLDVIPCSVEGKEKISQLLADGIIV